MIMCSKCKKRPAVVFITSVQGNEKKNEGLCLSCARSQNIPQIKEYMDKLGITDEELDQYLIQLYLYSHLAGKKYEMPISCLGFNCFRCKPPLIIEQYVQEKADLAVKWFTDNVARISEETEFCPDMEEFKCKNLCDVHDHCEYYRMTWGDEK